MPGLNLWGSSTGGYGGSGTTAALPPSYAASAAGATISSRAYGVGSSTGSAGPRTAGWGTVTTGMVATALLLYLWWSLPR